MSRPHSTRNPQPLRAAISHGRRAAWLALGLLALLIGAVGIVVPLLPTTPFVILAAFAFGKSIPALRTRLRESRVFGPMIGDWEAHGAIAPRYKVLAGVMMAATFAISLALSVSTEILVVQALCLAAAFSYVATRPNGPRRDPDRRAG